MTLLIYIQRAFVVVGDNMLQRTHTHGGGGGLHCARTTDNNPEASSSLVVGRGRCRTETVTLVGVRFATQLNTQKRQRNVDY